MEIEQGTDTEYAISNYIKGVQLLYGQYIEHGHYLNFFYLLYFITYMSLVCFYTYQPIVLWLGTGQCMILTCSNRTKRKSNYCILLSKRFFITLFN